MPLFLFPKAVRKKDQPVRILHLIPLDDHTAAKERTVGQATALRANSKPSGATHNSIAQKSTEETTGARETHTNTRTHACKAASNADSQRATPITTEQEPICDAANAPISMFLSAAPFHTDETLDALKTSLSAPDASASEPDTDQRTQPDTEACEKNTSQAQRADSAEQDKPKQATVIAQEIAHDTPCGHPASVEKAWKKSERSQRNSSQSPTNAKDPLATEPTDEASTHPARSIPQDSTHASAHTKPFAPLPPEVDPIQETVDCNRHNTQSQAVCFSCDCKSVSHKCEHTGAEQAKNTSERILLQIPIESILPNPQQPRKAFDAEALEELARSIRQYGVLQPLIIRKSDKSTDKKPLYELIAGERRLHAARIAHLYSVPCLLIHATQEDSAAIAIIENLQRKNLNHFEQAQAIQALISKYHYTQEQIASRLGCSQSYVANKLRILRLSADEQALILQNNLSERHARALLQLTNPEERKKLLIQIIENHWNVAETEHQITMLLAEKNSTIEPFSAHRTPLEAQCLRSIDRAVHRFRQNGGFVSCEKHENQDATEWVIRFTRQ